DRRPTEYLINTGNRFGRWSTRPVAASTKDSKTSSIFSFVDLAAHLGQVISLSTFLVFGSKASSKKTISLEQFPQVKISLQTVKSILALLPSVWMVSNIHPSSCSTVRRIFLAFSEKTCVSNGKFSP